MLKDLRWADAADTRVTTIAHPRAGRKQSKSVLTDGITTHLRQGAGAAA